jgi:hypothetical protein
MGVAGSLKIMRASFDELEDIAMKFIETVGESLIPYSEIIEIEKCGKRKSIIKTKGRKKFVVHDTPSDLQYCIEEETTQVIPAQPGYSKVYAVEPKQETGEWTTFSLPVLGWRIDKEIDLDTFIDAIPIAVGLQSGFHSSAIMLPDGKIASWHRCDPYLSVEDWLAAVKKRHERDKELWEEC